MAQPAADDGADRSAHVADLHEQLDRDDVLQGIMRHGAIQGHPTAITYALGTDLDTYKRCMSQPLAWEITDYMHAREGLHGLNPLMAAPAEGVPFEQPSAETLKHTRWFVNKLCHATITKTYPHGKTAVIPLVSFFFYHLWMLPEPQWYELSLYFATDDEHEGVLPQSLPFEECAKHYYMTQLYVDGLTRDVLQASAGKWSPAGIHGSTRGYLAVGVELPEDTDVVATAEVKASLAFQTFLETHVQCEPSVCMGSELKDIPVAERTHMDMLNCDLRLRGIVYEGHGNTLRAKLHEALDQCFTVDDLPAPRGPVTA